MPRHEWTNEETIVLIYFRSCGLTLTQILQLLYHKCNSSPASFGLWAQDNAHNKLLKIIRWEREEHQVNLLRDPLNEKRTGSATDWNRDAVDDYLMTLTDDSDVLARLTSFDAADAEIVVRVSCDAKNGPLC